MATPPQHLHAKCDSCGSVNLLAVPATPGDHSHIAVGERLLHPIAVRKYVCADCGRIEEWVNDAADLERLRAELRRRGAGENG